MYDVQICMTPDGGIQVRVNGRSVGGITDPEASLVSTVEEPVVEEQTADGEWGTLLPNESLGIYNTAELQQYLGSRIRIRSTWSPPWGKNFTHHYNRQKFCLPSDQMVLDILAKFEIVWMPNRMKSIVQVCKFIFYLFPKLSRQIHFERFTRIYYLYVRNNYPNHNSFGSANKHTLYQYARKCRLSINP